MTERDAATATTSAAEADSLALLAERDALLERGEAAWQAFQTSLAGLSEDEYERPNIEGVWSLKDVLSHHVGWHVEAARVLRDWADGVAFPPVPPFDAFNAAQVQLRSGADPQAVLDELREAYAAWVRAIRRQPAARVTPELLRHWTLRAMVNHWAEHADSVRRARELAGSEGRGLGDDA